MRLFRASRHLQCPHIANIRKSLLVQFLSQVDPVPPYEIAFMEYSYAEIVCGEK